MRNGAQIGKLENEVLPPQCSGRSSSSWVGRGAVGGVVATAAAASTSRESARAAWAEGAGIEGGRMEEA